MATPLVPEATFQDLKAWVDSRPPNSVVGVTCDSGNCLLATYYFHLTGKIVVVNTGVRFKRFDTGRGLLEWETEVVRLFDRLADEKEITADDPLLIEMMSYLEEVYP